MKLDTHVHTRYSAYSTIRPLRRIMCESYNTPHGVYQMTRERGMDLVTITDHDTIDGALQLSEHFTEVVRHPLQWRAQMHWWGGVCGLPLVPMALAGAYLHFLGEERFNHDLLFDLVARPARVLDAVPGLAA